MSANNPDDPTVDLSEETPKTTPIWEQVLEGIKTLHNEVVGLREDVRDLKMAVRSLERRFDIIAKDIQIVCG